MKPETRFRINQVDPFLRKLNATTSLSIQQRAISGTPDKLLCSNGRFVALELKRDGGEVSELQKIKLREIHASHGVAMVACPANWAKAKEILLKLDRGEHYDQTEIFGIELF